MRRWADTQVHLAVPSLNYIVPAKSVAYPPEHPSPIHDLSEESR